MPIFLIVPFYFMKRNEWNTDAFEKVYGALLEGTRIQQRQQEDKGNWAMLLMPTIFLYRRLIFVTSTILLKDNIFALILIQIGLIQFQLVILHMLRTFESRAALWKQTLDEVTYLLLIYIIMCFTDFVPDPEQRRLLGIVYLSIMFINIGLHLITLIRSTISSIVLSFKRWFARRHLYWCWCSCFLFCRRQARSEPSH